ncbi:unnamed protein product [Callosobruchus maculatus]|uniref:Uncharacterized protein n=1 Tax=Callosobruchus maculatus TaxID=64391 RepID=A0A653DKU5_CALMS|nr:unnamed protein product [Callosobruchus maculatus]
MYFLGSRTYSARRGDTREAEITHFDNFPK